MYNIFLLVPEKLWNKILQKENYAKFQEKKPTRITKNNIRLKKKEIYFLMLKMIL